MALNNENSSTPDAPQTGNAQHPSVEKIILGIDPGTNVMGYGLLEVRDKKPHLIVMGVLQLSKFESHYLRLKRIFERVQGLIEQYHPDELAIESPFLGINVQSMVKLCRAQGVAMAAAVSRDLPVFEYAPMKVKMAITGNGSASKEQVSAMLCRILHITPDELGKKLDATDALGIALCHYYETSRPVSAATGGCKSWKDFMQKHPDKVRGGK
jgi:crossover junction endodeoxyribonuclease RuvC